MEVKHVKMDNTRRSAVPYGNGFLGPVVESWEVNVNNRNNKLSPSGRFYTKGNAHHIKSHHNFRNKFKIRIDVMNKQTTHGYKFCLNIPMPVVQRQDPTLRSLFKFIGWRRRQKFVPKKLVRFKKFTSRIIIFNKCIKFCKGKNLISVVPKYLAIEYVHQVSKKEKFDSSEYLFNKVKSKIFHPELKYICHKIFNSYNKLAPTNVSIKVPTSSETISKSPPSNISSVLPPSKTLCLLANTSIREVPVTILSAPTVLTEALVDSKKADLSPIPDVSSNLSLPSSSCLLTPAHKLPSDADSVLIEDVCINVCIEKIPLIIPLSASALPEIQFESVALLHKGDHLLGASDNSSIIVADTFSEHINSVSTSVAEYSSLPSVVSAESDLSLVESNMEASARPKECVASNESVSLKSKSKRKKKHKTVKSNTPTLDSSSEKDPYVKDFDLLYTSVSDMLIEDRRLAVTIMRYIGGCTWTDIISCLKIPFLESSESEPGNIIHSFSYSGRDLDNMAMFCWDHIWEARSPVEPAHFAIANIWLAYMHSLYSPRSSSIDTFSFAHTSEFPLAPNHYFTKDFDELFRAVELILKDHNQMAMAAVLHIDGSGVEDFMSCLKMPFQGSTAKRPKSVAYQCSYSIETIESLEEFFHYLLDEGCPPLAPFLFGLAAGFKAYIDSLSSPTGPFLIKIPFELPDCATSEDFDGEYMHYLRQEILMWRAAIADSNKGTVTKSRVSKAKKRNKEPTYITKKKRRSSRVEFIDVY